MAFIKSIFLSTILFCMLSIKVSAQFKWAEIGVDGLTCSACTRAVEMNIRKLDFVDSVSMNLENTKGRIIFKTGAQVDIDKIASAVFDAGFSVRFLKASFVFANLSISNGFNWTNNNKQYCFVKTDNKILNGETVLTFIGKKFMSSKVYKEWKKNVGDCFGKSDKKAYCVTI